MNPLPGDDVIESADSEPLESTTATAKSGFLRILNVPAAIAVFLVRCYQAVLSPVLGRTCRFHPSCSQYYILAVQKHGLRIGSWRGICRIARCHPWNPGGYDPP